jgi:rubredoxin
MATRPKKPEPCRWVYDADHGKWDAACGLAWCFTTEDGPREHGVNYCPSCGRKLKIQ